MDNFGKILAGLNAAQREAVDNIYGPVLVIAGPGTGKTQLLSARVANILKRTDTLPQNILCLTFTENGALNMRERLGRFIGPSAYDVTISTYHGFGSAIIGRFPEYFTDLRLERAVDELGKHQILSKIIDNTDYRSPIKQTRHHLGDLISTISEVKRGLLTPDELRRIAKENVQIINSTAKEIGHLLRPHAARMPSKMSVAVPLWQNVLAVLCSENPGASNAKYERLDSLAANDLQSALEEAEALDKTTPLTKWKNKWLVKNKSNDFVLAGALESSRINALADVLEIYQQTLAEQGLYDFDDMILRAIEVLEQNDDLRYTLQEQYQFILLDEFQDTNAAQLRLVELITDNPVHEGRPNILAVGDDDQAIYAFQGAQYSNMLDYYHMFRDVTVINLSENYRSLKPIIEAAGNISSQIESRLHTHLDGVSKNLIPHKTSTANEVITRTHYASDIAERSGVAAEIKQLIENGVPAKNIAILAPKHSYLEKIVPYLQDLNIPVSYEKRENILDSQAIRQILTISKLIITISRQQMKIADSLWPEVLSYDFWGFSVEDIWKCSWEANDKRKKWTEILLSKKEFKHASLIILALAGKVGVDSCETILDGIIGIADVQTREANMPSVRCPFYEFYLKQGGETLMYQTVTELNVLRSKLRDHQAIQGNLMTLSDLIDFINQYEAAEEQMLNTSPYNQSADSIQLMSVYKAKGLEWDHVYLISCHDDVWGSKSSGSSNKLTLPANLAPIRHAGSTEDERLRLLFVAITRAKIGLHLSSYSENFAGKKTERLKYFDEVEGENGIFVARSLPESYQNVKVDGREAPSIETVLLDWKTKHLNYHDTTLKSLLQDRLKKYQLSPTHLTNFIDLEHGGPDSFLFSTLLRFGGAPRAESSFGNAIHETLEWMQNEINQGNNQPSIKAATAYAESYLEREPLTPEQIAQEQRHAKQTLEAYLAKRIFRIGNVPEMSFHAQGVMIGDVHMGGKIDLLEIDEAKKEIVVVDYKTGIPETSWKPETIKLHKYSLQLYCYKLLVEGSIKYRGYRVTSGRLEFIEPGNDGELHTLKLDFDHRRLEEVRALLAAMWRSVQALDLPDISEYSKSLTSVKQFEKNLIESM